MIRECVSDIRIKLITIENILVFTEINRKSTLNVDVGESSKILDGCSVLGLMTMDIRRPVRVRVYGDSKKVNDLFEEYRNHRLDFDFVN